MIPLNTLVLNPDMSPVSLFPIKKMPVEQAIVRVLEGDSVLLASHERPCLTPSRNDLFWPSVIVNKRFEKKRNDVILKRETLFYRDHGICQYCLAELSPTTITCDHVMPKAKGGKHGWDNVVSACKACNAAKSDSLPKGKWVPRIKPYVPSIYELNERRKDFPIVVDNMNWLDFIGPWNAEVILRKKAA